LERAGVDPALVGSKLEVAGPRLVPDGDHEISNDEKSGMASPSRHTVCSHTGHENDDGELLFDELAASRGLSLLTTTLIKTAWAPETFRKMRHSWRLFNDFLTLQKKSYEVLLELNASVIANNFKAYAEARQLSSIEARISHTNVLVDVFKPNGKKLSALVSRAVRRKRPKKGRKYRTMWDVTELLTFLASRYADNAALSGADLLTKTLALTMIYSACRLAELARMTVDPNQVNETRLRVDTNLKTALDTRDFIMFYPVEDSRVCPHAAIREWLGRRTPHAALFTHPTTNAPLTANTIATTLRELMTQAGISGEYGPYSIKHAVITYLFVHGAEEAQINEFGRWSIGSRVASTHYKIATPRRHWLGYRLAEGVTTQQTAEEATSRPSNGVRLAAEVSGMVSSTSGRVTISGPEIKAQLKE
jgi:site-specific recombinase XerD